MSTDDLPGESRPEEEQPALEIRPAIFNAGAYASLSNANLWHLGASQAGGARFIQAWNQVLAAGVTVSVVDEGVNYRHVDLQSAYDTSIDYDPRDAGTNDAAPDTANQGHGTWVAGVIAGNIANEIGTVGAAQGATITGTYIRYGALFDLNELDDILAHQQNYDVSNNSWGFSQAFADNFSTAQFAASAAGLHTAIEDGRDGLGTVMVFAAGNGKVVTTQGNIGDDSNFHNLSNSRFVIAAGAHDINGNIASFSSPGTNVLLTAAGVGVLTTDGTANGSQSSAFVSGTSFAAPLVSSAVALMLAENPNLGYRDVQEILVLSSASRVGGHSVENAFGGFNGGGLMFDREGGFGRLDAEAAVALARNWSATSTLDNEQGVGFSFAQTNNIVGGHTVLQAQLDNTSGYGFSAQWVELHVKISDPDLKDLHIDLISADGTRATIAENMLSVGSRTSLDFTFTSAMTWGEDPYGTWQIEFSHGGATPTFSVLQADVRVYGDLDTVNDEYYYTQSFAQLVAQDATRRFATDADGGTDTLNFAAARSTVRVDLSGAGPSSFQGVDIVLNSQFENVIGSLADDILTGSNQANRLVGDFGNDWMAGGNGDDTLIGGAGDDTLTGGAGADVMDGGSGEDRAVFHGLRSAYTIDKVGNEFHFSGADGVDILTDIESASFDDITVLLTANGVVTPPPPPPPPTFTPPMVSFGSGAFGADSSAGFLLRRSDGMLQIGDIQTNQVSTHVLGGLGNDWRFIAVGDFNGNVTSDLLWQHESDGMLLIHSIGSNQVMGASFLGALGGDWTIRGTGDFNHDGTDDLLWQREGDGMLLIHDIRSNTVLGHAFLGQIGTDFRFLGTADYNKDGTSDLLWQGSDGMLLIHDVQSNQVSGAAFLGRIGTDWHFAGTGDFNGDHMNDLLFQAEDGTLRTYTINNSQVANSQVLEVLSLDRHVVGIGDYSGDGVDDLLVRRDDGSFELHRMENGVLAQTLTLGQVGTDWHIV